MNAHHARSQFVPFGRRCSRQALIISASRLRSIRCEMLHPQIVASGIVDSVRWSGRNALEGEFHCLYTKSKPELRLGAPCIEKNEAHTRWPPLHSRSIPNPGLLHRQHREMPRYEPNPTISTRASSGKVLYRMITTANLTQVFGYVKLSQQSIRIISGVFPTPA